MKQAFADTGIAVSLVAELDDHVVGFLLARVYYGEFGVVEPAAVLDVLGVRSRTIAAGAWRPRCVDQLRTNLLGLGIPTLQTRCGGSKPRADQRSSSTKGSRSRRGCASIWICERTRALTPR